MNEWTDLEAARGVLLAAGGAMETERLIDHVGRAATRGLHRHGVDGGSLITAIRGTADIERVIAGQRGGVVTCLSAAHAHGIPLIGNPPGAVHLAVPRSRSRLRGGKRTPGIVVHKTLQVGGKARGPLDLVQDRPIGEPGQKTARIAFREGPLVQVFKGNVRLAGEGVANQRGLARLSRAGDDHNGVLRCPFCQGAFQCPFHVSACHV